MSAHWRHRPEGGGLFALWLIRTIALRCGRPVARVVLYPVTLYFFLRRRPERRSSRQFLQRVLGRPATLREVFRHLHAFAAITLDRVFMLARGERGFAVQVEGLERLHEALDEGRGAVLIGSHHGSFEALRMLSQRYPQVPLRVVLNKQQTPAMTALLEALAPDIGERVIDGAQDPASVVLALGEAVREGHMVALLADRGRPDEAMLKVPFFGEPAPFPLGPWLLAVSLRVPVVLCFGLYLGGNRYKLVFESFADTAMLPRRGRREAVQAYVQAYAARLEALARAYPYNWFNFYDFWHDTPRVAGTDAGAGVGDDVGARA
ncbi:acyltransferase [Oleiagrimonas soli]|uniref:Acyltransferase n=1 Tax=Oleiagrimonas soli TaxID=1543381 RepID=A0A099CSW8_9GAMM|nr:acyltransferase [Oleiagrimonas soli]KGI76732.1 acyltransferase [Oleiagrimonas soli]MBB6185035.1 putative LPLAT superfamily acyltransferase [Oleiagrimonas soli]